MKLVKLWYWLPRKIVDIQNLTGYGAGQPALVDLPVNRGLDDPHKCPPFLTVLIWWDFVSMTNSQN